MPGFYLRRPFSPCDWDGDGLRLVYKTLGEGTRAMTALKWGDELDVLTGLGNGFDVSRSGLRPLLIGGGAGVPPLLRLCRTLVAQGKQPQVTLGFNSGADVYFEEEFRQLGVPAQVTTMDGAAGVQGTVLTSCQMGECTYFYACGPMAMLRAVCAAACTDGQLSLEERMGCSFGACMGCTVVTRQGSKRVCKEGPVFTREALGW